MKIVTWNCPNKFAEKSHLMRAMCPDILVVQECARKDIDALKQEGYSALWFGSNEKKGLAVFAASPWVIDEIAPPENTWVVPVKVSGPANFVLLAIWAWHATSRRYAGYVEQLCDAVRKHPEWFNQGPAIVAGDFNSSTKFDKRISGDNHSSLVSMLEERGVTSAYHHFYGEHQGSETKSTHFHRWDKENPFHLDYIFIPQEWRSRLNSVEVGQVEEWIGHSDHCPLIATIAPSDSAVSI